MANSCQFIGWLKLKGMRRDRGWGLMANCCNDDPTPSHFPFFFVGIRRGERGAKKRDKVSESAILELAIQRIRGDWKFEKN